MASHTLMATEIDEAADAVASQLATNRNAVAALAAKLRARNPAVIVTIARGSSDHAALYLKYLIEIGLGLPCASVGPSIGSVYRRPFRLEGAIAITISQSGRSPDIVAMQQAAKAAGALTIALVNDTSSPVANEADECLPLLAGPERAVAATKSMIASLVAGASLVAAWSEDAALTSALEAVPALLAGADKEVPADALAWIAAQRSALVLGRGATFGIAAEAALKLKETCALHAEAFSAAEVLHGPTALVGPGFPVIAFMPQDAARDAMQATLERLGELGAQCLTYDTMAAPGVIEIASTAHPLVTPIAMVHAFYRLAEAAARARGRDPDRPPHLSKVTRTT
jgi:glucosamine--fructose-6-phosphate aminotransferase (isomerizing)